MIFFRSTSITIVCFINCIYINCFYTYNYHTLIRGVFHKYAERFHRMFAIAARLMIFHVKHAWYMFIKYR